MLTWDSRGFGQSGGTVEVDSKDFEGRDVQVLIDWLAKQPEAGSTSPATRAWACTASPTRAGSSSSRRGSTSGSTRSRPTIAWHSLLTALYKEDTVKGGWAPRCTAPACRPPA